MLIDPKLIQEALKQDTYFKWIDGKHVILPYSEVRPLPGYVEPENFPNCCLYHKAIFEAGIRRYDEFPDCCERHKEMKKHPLFEKRMYESLPLKVVKQIAYTIHCIIENIDKPDWYDIITEYIEYNDVSFGSPRVGADHYFLSLIHAIKSHKESLPLQEQKREELLKYIDTLLYGKEKQNPDFDLNKLYDIYQKWLNLFPFGISFFTEAKIFFSKQLPFLAEPPKTNRYNGATKSSIITEKGFLQYLNSLTKTLLGAIDTQQMVRDGIISNADKHHFEFILEHQRIVQLNITKDFSKDENQYKKAITQWLKNEKDFFREIAPFLLTHNVKSGSTISNNLIIELNKFGFSQLPALKILKNPEGIYELLIKNELPYKIALLNKLGFLDYLEKEYCKSKDERNKKLAQILLTNSRAIKGNISVLNPKSNEDKSKYTAHLHKEKVEKDYNLLK